MPEKMVSLKRDKATALTADSPDEPFFPHSLFFDEEDISKLGLEEVQLGDERQMVITVRVVSISSNESSDGKRSNISLNITEGAVAPVGQRSAAERIFGGSDGN